MPEARFACTGRLRGRLYDLGHYPTLTHDESADWVTGEVYRVPARGWAALDALEDVVTEARPLGHYFRVARGVQCDDGVPRTCQVYVANPVAQDLSRPIPSGDWMAWHAARLKE